jgi:hypothetical protein
MTMGKSSNKHPTAAFLEAQFRDLVATPDSEVLAGTTEEEARAFGLALVRSAKAAVAKRKFAAAKAALARGTEAEEAALPAPVSVAEARAFISAAANDSRFTLAARQLDEMSDEDILRLYATMQQVLADAKGENGK